MGGAASVTAVDVSEEAVHMTEENIRRNGLEQVVTAKQANVFDLLTDLADHKNHALISSSSIRRRLPSQAIP